jgi:hypothetical protein
MKIERKRIVDHMLLDQRKAKEAAVTEAIYPQAVRARMAPTNMIDFLNLFFICSPS